MIPRHLAETVVRAARAYPVVTVTGPRQSGKTTLVRAAFPHMEYANLEMPDVRGWALEDPRGFLRRFSGGVIIDEAQRAPDLFSYIQGMVDEDPTPGRFILSGSQNFLLLDRISQTLAGRVSVQHLMPFSLQELMRAPRRTPESLGEAPPGVQKPESGLVEVLHRGFFPRIHDQNLDAGDWLMNYFETYLERDVRSVINVGDLQAFSRFMALCAGRTGQLLNLSGLAADAGVSHTTVRRWLSVLEASFQVLLVPPFRRNFRKRLVKSPKLYFLDCGLLCQLLHIRSPEELYVHSARGAIFESFVASEVHKRFLHSGQRPWLSFWRDRSGFEVDLVCEFGPGAVAMECKSGETVHSDTLDSLVRWGSMAGETCQRMALVYAGDDSHQRRGVQLLPWWQL